VNLYHIWRAEPTDQTPNVQKAFAYVTRRPVHGPEIVVFTHTDPESGIQVPKGTVEGGETPAEAALREVYEECGLGGLRLVRHLATDTVHFPNDPKNRQIQQRYFYEVRAPASTPERWRHRVSAGAGDAGLTFTCFWLHVSQSDTVIANMGDYLHLLE
jgi:putative (di)nucleoside polyphosphate hydrolase